MVLFHTDYQLKASRAAEDAGGQLRISEPGVTSGKALLCLLQYWDGKWLA